MKWQIRYYLNKNIHKNGIPTFKKVISKSIENGNNYDKYKYRNSRYIVFWSNLEVGYYASNYSTAN